ncbi:MAG: helix-turn-helix transcriptional regulator [Verrucomicrobiia bacterium]|jgi:transcriptional regulator with XRE-family HTH domain
MSRSKSDNDSRRLFTANFRMLLEAADWTQMEAAAQLGISQGSVSDFSSGNRLPSMKGIESIAYRLGLPAETFTAKPIKLDQMRKFLSGSHTPKVAERGAVYRAVKPYDPWFQALKQRWGRSPGSREEMRVAVRMLFGSRGRKVLDWLDEK